MAWELKNVPVVGGAPPTPPHGLEGEVVSFATFDALKNAPAGSLTGKIDSTTWVGPDRERFHSDWTGNYVQQLTTVMNGLREASTNAGTNANQQEQASA